MKITRRTNEITFGELCSGDVFIYKNRVYIKTECLDDWGKEAAVDLEDGEILEFSDIDTVEELPDAELTI